MVCGAAGLCARRRHAAGALAGMERGGQDPAGQSSAIFRLRILCPAGLPEALQRAHAPPDPAATEGRVTRHLAQLNIGKFRAGRDDPAMAYFFDNLDRVYAMAERMPGFVW